MKYILSLSIVLFCALQLDAQLFLERFSESVYICVDQYYPGENSLAYIGEEYISLIGATWCPASARALHDSLAKLTDKPVMEVINTNYHPDRAGGNVYWRSIGCEIHSTQKTCELLQSDWDSICQFVRNTSPGFPDIPLILPTKVHKGNFKLQEGEIEVLYFGPSHTDDGVFAYLPEEKLLYGGCILKPFLGNLDQAKVREYSLTLRKLKAHDLEIETIIAGHGTPVHDETLIDSYLALLKDYNGPEQ